MLKFIILLFILLPLSSVYCTETEPIPKLKGYSDIFLNALLNNQFSFTLTKGVGFKSNVYELANSDDDSSFHYLNFNSYYSINPSQDLSQTLYFDYTDKYHLNKKTNTQDERYFTPGYELKYKLTEESQIGISYYYSHEMERRVSQGKFSTYANTHEITPSIFYYKHNAQFIFTLPYKYVHYARYDKTQDVGIKLSYTKSLDSKYFYPSISIGHNQISETDEGIKDSTEGFLSLSNYFYPGNDFNGYIMIDYTKRSNNNKEYAYHDFTVTLYSTLLNLFIKNLSLGFTASHEYTKYDSKDTSNISEFKLDLAYQFTHH